MSFLSALFEQRAIDISDFPIGDELFVSKSDAGVRVTRETALRVVAAYACITLIADAIRAMPVDVFRRRGDARQRVDREPGWVSTPNPYQPWGPFIDFQLHSLLTSGNAVSFITEFNDMGFPAQFEPIHPDDLEIEDVKGRKRIRINGEQVEEFTASNPGGRAIHTMGHSANGIVGLSPIEEAAQALGLALATEKFGAKFFGQGAQASGVLEMPAGSNPSTEQLSSLRKMFKKRFGGTDNAWQPIVLANGASYKAISLPNDQAQFIESRKFSVAEIARLYRVPPHLIGDVERSTSWGTGIEQQGIGFVTYTLTPWMTRLEESFSRLLPRGQFIKFNANGLLRGDVEARFNAYSVARTGGWMSVNEIRALEDMEPIIDGDTFLTPVNMTQGEDDAQPTV